MWPNPPETTDLVTFTEEFLNGKLHFLCSDVILESLQYLEYHTSEKASSSLTSTVTKLEKRYKLITIVNNQRLDGSS